MIVLSKKEQLKLEIVVKVHTGLMSRTKAIQVLQVSERTLRRYLKAYKQQDILFLKHGNYEKKPHNNTPDLIKDMVQFLVKSKYFDFNILYFQEKLRDHSLEITRESLIFRGDDTFSF